MSLVVALPSTLLPSLMPSTVAVAQCGPPDSGSHLKATSSFKAGTQLSPGSVTHTRYAITVPSSASFRSQVSRRCGLPSSTSVWVRRAATSAGPAAAASLAAHSRTCCSTFAANRLLCRRRNLCTCRAFHSTNVSLPVWVDRSDAPHSL